MTLFAKSPFHAAMDQNSNQTSRKQLTAEYEQDKAVEGTAVSGKNGGYKSTRTMEHKVQEQNKKQEEKQEKQRKQEDKGETQEVLPAIEATKAQGWTILKCKNRTKSKRGSCACLQLSTSSVHGSLNSAVHL